MTCARQAPRGRPGRPAARHAGRRREFRRFPGRLMRSVRECPSAGPPSSGGIRIRGPAAPGREASCPPARRCHSPRRYAAGDLRAPGLCCPNPGQTVNNPPRQPVRAVLPQRAAQKPPSLPARPAPPDAYLVGDLPHYPQPMTGPVPPPAVPAAGDVLPVQASGPGLAGPAGRVGVMDLQRNIPSPALI